MALIKLHKSEPASSHKLKMFEGMMGESLRGHYGGLELSKGERPIGDRTPSRPHFLVEWAKRRGLKQSDIADAIGASRGLVSTWFSRGTPGKQYQAALAELFDCEPEAIFRNPDEEWMISFLKGREPEEIERIKKTLLAAFPPRIYDLDKKRIASVIESKKGL